MTECKHEYTPEFPAQVCIHCGFLKSTIESEDTAPFTMIIKNRHYGKTHKPIPDSWSQRFDEQFVIGRDIPHNSSVVNAELLKSFIQQELDTRTKEIIDSIPYKVDWLEDGDDAVHPMIKLKQQLKDKLKGNE